MVLVPRAIRFVSRLSFTEKYRFFPLYRPGLR